MFLVLKNWILSIVVIIMFLSLVDILLPNNSLKKYAKLAMGLIVIIIIITPIFNLFNGKADINRLVSEYMIKYDNKSIPNDKNTNDIINSNTISVFKEKLKAEIEKYISDNIKNKYKISKLEVIEDQKADNFLEVFNIELKAQPNNNLIKAVSKITIQAEKNKNTYFWDKEVADGLKNKFDIKASAIKFVK